MQRGVGIKVWRFTYCQDDVKSKSQIEVKYKIRSNTSIVERETNLHHAALKKTYSHGPCPYCLYIDCVRNMLHNGEDSPAHAMLLRPRIISLLYCAAADWLRETSLTFVLCKSITFGINNWTIQHPTFIITSTRAQQSKLHFNICFSLKVERNPI